MQDLQEIIISQFNQIDVVQFIVLTFGIAEVLLARANRILLYPAGIISTSFAMYGLFHAQLYAECLLHFYYIIMSIYGWWFWSSGKSKRVLPISFTSKLEWYVTVLISVGGWFFLYLVLVTYTDSNVPMLDSLVSSTAWAGTWLLAKRKVENWIILNVSNVIAIPLLFYKQLPLFAFLTIFLFIVACWGYIDWRKNATRTFIAA